jgi:uncharacterized membrane protein YraQ (UPF0718 family)
MTITSIVDQFVNFTTVFLGIFIEAAPFLLLGSIASGMVEVFVRQEDITRLIPSNPLMATLMGGLLGLAFPVCECGVVPLTRRLFKKGLPTSAGIAFLLAAPILNPVVIASTFAAYGFSRILAARLFLGLLIPFIVGVIFSFNRKPLNILRLQVIPELPTGMTPPPASEVDATRPTIRERVRIGLRIAADEFFEMGRYLVIGAMLAALMQTLVPQNVLLSVGTGPLTSVLLMQVLAYVLSVCSTVDAFVSLAFAGTFSTGALLSFLVFGPMVDIKSTLMFLGVFKRKTVVYLIVLPFLLTAAAAVFINLYLNW